MARIYRTVFQLRRGQHDEWIEGNPILNEGEPAFETDTFRLKIGDGKTVYQALPYIGGDGSEDDARVVNADTHYDFPSIGKTNTIYKADKERTLYQWDEETLTYVSLNSFENVKIIHGGNADGYDYI